MLSLIPCLGGCFHFLTQEIVWRKPGRGTVEPRLVETFRSSCKTNIVMQIYSYIFWSNICMNEYSWMEWIKYLNIFVTKFFICQKTGLAHYGGTRSIWFVCLIVNVCLCLNSHLEANFIINQISNAKCQMSNFKGQMPNVKCKCQNSKVKFQISNVKGTKCKKNQKCQILKECTECPKYQNVKMSKML